VTAHSFPGLGHRDDSPAVQEQRAAIAELGEALRELVQRSSATEAPPEEQREIAALLREAAARLAKYPRERAQMPSADNLLAGIRMYNPVTGPGSALAAPLHIEVIDGLVVGTCTLGLAFEGPPMYVHGGVSALLMDQILGYAVGVAGRPGLTVTLDTRYRAPVPLQTPLRLTAQMTGEEGRSVTAAGIIATAADPDTPLVEATARFVRPRPDQAVKLFGRALHPDAMDPSAAHD